MAEAYFEGTNDINSRSINDYFILKIQLINSRMESGRLIYADP